MQQCALKVRSYYSSQITGAVAIDVRLMSFFFFSLQATLAILDKLDIETENPTEEEVARKFGWEDDYLADDLSLWQRVKPKIFSLFDEPHSSTCARVRKP